MIPSGVAANPPGRVLNAWWQQLSSYVPRRLWFADLIVRRLEILVRQSRLASLDPLHRLLLEAATTAPAQLPKRLGLNDNLIRLMMSELVTHGLVRVDERGGWTATDAGARAAIQGQFPISVYERQTFRLLSRSHAFLPLWAEGTPAALTGEARPALDSLRAAVGQSLEWKQRRGFPEDVEAFLDLDSDSSPPIPSWKRVPFEGGERHLLALIQTSNERLLAFTVRLDGTVTGKSPCLELEFPIAAEILGLSEPGADAWRESWHHWCQPIRGISAGDVEACAIDRFNHVLRVRMPAELRQRMKAERPEAFKSEAWLLAGDPPCRLACLLDLP